MAHIADRIAEAIEAERLVEGTGHTDDEAYNQAVDDALAAVERVAAQPDPLRELAEWLVALRPVEGVRSSVIGGPDARLNEAIARARKALGKEE